MFAVISLKNIKPELSVNVDKPNKYFGFLCLQKKNTLNRNDANGVDSHLPLPPCILLLSFDPESICLIRFSLPLFLLDVCVCVYVRAHSLLELSVTCCEKRSNTIIDERASK